MKKSTLLFSMLLAGTVAMAQSNFASISQIGNNHEALVEQTGLENASTVDITGGNGSEIIVDQIGNKNFSSFNGAGSVFGFQYQEGDNNTATAARFGNGSIINQIQIGDGNSASADRWTQSSNLIVSQYQEGDNNTAVARRLRGFDVTVIDQTQIGDRNVALLNPTGSGQYYADGGSVNQYQEGDDNFATINNISGSLGGLFIQEQIGNDNSSIIRGGRRTTLAATYQEGDFNNATIEQFDSFNTAEIFQFGDSNNALIQQTGEMNVGIITQHGNGNMATITQR
ncbi:hypothetical protein [Mongoliibacter ruber]|uniref:Curlin associated repeat-containing protein n=1 Tax=Mongoliibacter ruber TaxID=1750599 RepID=A0A2T0WJT0_9BACT|nr:hypothetical protein [Mongoliibacter ruber]PRY86961.1 Curlin associated repeat-containing protein [Mongoliibacter ruber]